MSKYGVISGPNSVRMRKNTDQKLLRIWTIFTQWSGIYADTKNWLLVESKIKIL